MQGPLGERMQLVPLNSLRHSGRNHVLEHFALDLFLKTQTHDIERRIALSKAGHARAVGIFLADLTVRFLDRGGVDLQMYLFLCRRNFLYFAFHLQKKHSEATEKCRMNCFEVVPSL